MLDIENSKCKGPEEVTGNVFENGRKSVWIKPNEQGRRQKKRRSKSKEKGGARTFGNLKAKVVVPVLLICHCFSFDLFGTSNREIPLHGFKHVLSSLYSP